MTIAGCMKLRKTDLVYACKQALRLPPRGQQISGRTRSRLLEQRVWTSSAGPWPLDEKAHGTSRRVERLSVGECVTAVVAVAAAAARQRADKRDGETSGGGSLGAAAATN